MICDFNDLQKRMEGAVDSFIHDLASLRTGRASTSLLDAVHVMAYGTMTPINQLATVSVSDSRTLSVAVWDKSVVGAVDRAIREADPGMNPVVEGTLLRVPLPELNEQRRKELVKIAHTYTENAKIAVRHVRRDGMDFLKKSEKDKKITEDDHRKESDKIQKLTDDIIARIDKMLSTKETEIMQI